MAHGCFLTNGQASRFFPWGVPSTGVSIFFLLSHGEETGAQG